MVFIQVTKWLLAFFVVSFITVAFITVSSLTLSSVTFASPMQAWESWVLQDYPQHDCPWMLANDQSKACVWPGKIVLAINDTGGHFTYTVKTYKKQSFVPLPGSAKHWPTEVSVNEEPARLINRGGVPHLVLNKGSHTVAGHFRWHKRPRQLVMPNSLAMVSLTIDGKAQVVDRRNGQLIFSNKSRDLSKKTNDSLSIEVFRLLQDGVPIKVNTHIRLSVSGKAREVTFGRVMLSGTEVLHIRSPIPARIEADGTMRAQVAPGEHTIEVMARFTSSPTVIRTQKLSQEWPDAEYLSFQSAPSIRQAKLSGATSIDTHQIRIPPSWRQLPTYHLSAQNTLNIATEFRGDHSPAANALHLQRDLWLDFDGNGMSAFDRIHGEMNQDWRLNVASGVHLGRATVDGDPVLITRDKGLQGIEIRSPRIQLDTVSRTDVNTGFSVSGWDADIDQYSATLHLPPGWRVLHASGVDQVWGTWLSKWDLWDVFLLLIIISVTRKLMGNRIAALSAVTFLIALHEPGTPLGIIPLLLILIALLPLVSGKLKTGLRNAGLVFMASLVLLMIGFAVDRFRLAIYPSLEQAQIGSYKHNRYNSKGVTQAASPQLLKSEIMESADLTSTAKSGQQRNVEPASKQQKQGLYQVTENDRVQTGPGLPTWTWNVIHLRSSGPVSSDQSLLIYYSKPMATSIWLVLSVLLVLAYSALVMTRFIKCCEFGTKGSSKATSVVTALSIALMALVILPHSPNAIAADHPSMQTMPPQYLMDKLEERLIKAPACLPTCTSLNNGLMRIEGTDFQLEFTAYVDANIALPLPKGYGSWTLTSLTEAGRDLPLKRTGDGVFVALTKGHHILTLAGKILDEQASIRFPLPIHNLSVVAKGWLVEGLIDGRVIKDTLTLRTIKQGTIEQANTLKADSPPNFARVRRHIHFGKRWMLTTSVMRETTAGAISLPVKLLPNERLLTEVGSIRNGEVTIQFEHRQQRIDWTSSLEPRQELVLEASSGSTYLEDWSFTPSSLWRLEYEGIPPLKARANANAFEPMFKPWPGEVLKVNIRKPEGIPGSVYTVESALLKVEAGNKLQRSTLTLKIRASIGTDYPITLPENAEVLKFSVDNRTMNTPAANQVLVPLQPREQTVTIEFQTPDAMAMLSYSPQVHLPGSATNIELQYQLPRDRWPLYLSGPAIGPAMLYWGVLLVIILGALGLPQLARAAKLTIPVSTLSWLLLGLGLSTVNSYGVLVIAIMFFILAARKAYVKPHLMNRFQFNTMQVGIVLWGSCALLSMLAAIPMGLLASPEMKVVGNGSNSHWYRYYQDMATAEEGLPRATIMSVPLIAYRVVMLLWSLWLSTRLIQWASWAWACYVEKGAWLEKGAGSERGAELEKESGRPKEEKNKKAQPSETEK